MNAMSTRVRSTHSSCGVQVVTVVVGEVACVVVVVVEVVVVYVVFVAIVVQWFCSQNLEEVSRRSASLAIHSESVISSVVA